MRDTFASGVGVVLATFFVNSNSVSMSQTLMAESRTVAYAPDHSRLAVASGRELVVKGVASDVVRRMRMARSALLEATTQLTRALDQIATGRVDPMYVLEYHQNRIGMR
jgi:hypothetical protein